MNCVLSTKYVPMHVILKKRKQIKVHEVKRAVIDRYFSGMF